jgi:hypothetical protein
MTRILWAAAALVAVAGASAPLARADDEDSRLAIGACGVLSMGYSVGQAVQEVEDKLAEDGLPASQARAERIVSRALESGCK